MISVRNPSGRARPGAHIRRRGTDPAGRRSAAIVAFSILLMAGCATTSIPRVTEPDPVSARTPVASEAESPSPGPSPSAIVATPGMSAAPWPGAWTPDSGPALHVPILTYHVIAPWAVALAYSQPSLDVDPAVFDAQLRALKRAGWHSITVSALADLLARGAASPTLTFVLTIDDGHTDGATYALPILERYGDVATFYVVAGRVGEVDNLSWDQVAQLTAAGMEIGDHTLGHLDLTRLTDTASRAQIEEAQARFLAALGTAPTTFAYPFGAFNENVVGFVRAAGFHLAVTTDRGAAESWDRRLQVPRIEVSPSLSPGDVLDTVAPFG